LQQRALPNGKPTLICCKTTIGQGAPTKAGSHDVHGAPLGTKEIEAMRAGLGWTHGPFEIPADIAKAWNARATGLASEAAWRARFDRYRAVYPELADEFERRMAGRFPTDFADKLAALHDDKALTAKIATRKASQLVLEHLVPALPEMFGGSADLSGSNLTNVKASVWLNHRNASAAGTPAANYLSYGVREFGMAAAMNGMALHGGFIPYGGTFMTFSDYSRNAIRMAALMKRGVIHVLTHDSIGLGEDGPTHQPIEHAASLRLIPNNRVWRPCDGEESSVAWELAVQRRDGPSCLVFTRQALTPYAGAVANRRAAIARGGYVLKEEANPQVVLIGTGSEVEIAIKAAEQLVADGVRVRVVSMPCVELFYAQDVEYRNSVLPKGTPRVSIEAGVTSPWRGVVGDNGVAIGIDSFGESAPAEALYAHFGLTADAVAKAARAVIAN
jgi:transketolase